MMFHKCSSQPNWVLSIWATKELTLFLLVWLYQTCPVCIPDVSGICPVIVKMLFSGWFVESSDVGREFRLSGVPTVGSSGKGREFRHLTLTVLEGSLSWSYRTCPVWTTRGQRLVFQSLEGQEFRRESGVPTVGSFGMRREFRHLTNFNSVTCG